MKLNFDGAKVASGQAAAWFVIRDSRGRVVSCGAHGLGSAPSIQAECLGLHVGLLFAVRMGFSRLVVEGDCLTIINALRGIGTCPWTIEMVITDVLGLCKSFEAICFSHTLREDNQVADRLAHVGLFSSFSVERCPAEIEDLVRKDAIGQWFNRG